MQRGKSGPGRRPVEDVLALREGRLRCRDCSTYCRTDRAIKESRGRSRCPDCGGILDREAPAEVPTAAPAAAPGLADAIRDAIRAAGPNTTAVAAGSGVPQPVLSRFVRGERGMTLESAEKVCRYLGLRLVREAEA